MKLIISNDEHDRQHLSDDEKEEIEILADKKKDITHAANLSFYSPLWK